MSIIYGSMVGGGGIGGSGEAGGYYAPAVDADGNLSWTASKTDMPAVDGANIKGPQGKSAYQYAQDGGYTGTEAEFAAKLAAEIPTSLSELSEDATHRVVTDAEKAKWNAKSNFSGSYNDLTDKPTIPDIPVQSVNGKTGAVVLSAEDVGALPGSTVIPTALPNPNTITFTGAAEGTYDGSNPLTVEIPVGADGKSAYQYAVEGGYTGTETEFAAKLAQEQLAGTTNDLTPTQVYQAVSAGIPVKVQYTDPTFGLSSFTAFNVSESMNVIVSNAIVNYNDMYLLAALYGNKSNNGWFYEVTPLAKPSDIPSALPNPKALTFTGAVTGRYDGSAPLSVKIPSAVTDAHINSLIDTKLGVIENGAY